MQLVRDLCSWCGLRQVSRRTFVRALEEKGSVMLVPGGQAELVHTWRIKCKKEYVVYGKHKGQQPFPTHLICLATFGQICAVIHYIYEHLPAHGLVMHPYLSAWCCWVIRYLGADAHCVECSWV